MSNHTSYSNATFIWELNQFLSVGPRVAQRIPSALKRIGEYVKADQVSIVDINHDMTITVSYRWSKNEEIIPPVTFTEFSFNFNKELEDLLGEKYHIEVHAHEKSINHGLNDILGKLKAQRAFFLPMSLTSHLFSFLIVGINSEKSWIPEIDFLINTSTLISGVLSRETLLTGITKHHAINHNFIENPIECMLRLDNQFNISFANNQFHSIMEKTKEEVTGVAFSKIVPEFKRYIQHAKDLLEQPDNVVSFESPIVRENDVIYVQWNIYVSPVTSEQNEYYIIGHDVSVYREESMALNHILEELWEKTGKNTPSS